MKKEYKLSIAFVVSWVFLFLVMLAGSVYFGKDVPEAIFSGNFDGLSRSEYGCFFVSLPVSIAYLIPSGRLLFNGLTSIEMSPSGMEVRTIAAFKPVRFQWSQVEEVRRMNGERPSYGGSSSSDFFKIIYRDHGKRRWTVIKPRAFGLGMAEVSSDLMAYGVLSR